MWTQMCAYVCVSFDFLSLSRFFLNFSKNTFLLCCHLVSDKMADTKKGGSGNYLAEADKSLEVCSVMISYSRKDKAFVKNIFDALAIDDREIWVDWEVGVI